MVSDELELSAARLLWDLEEAGVTAGVPTLSFSWAGEWDAHSGRFLKIERLVRHMVTVSWRYGRPPERPRENLGQLLAIQRAVGGLWSLDQLLPRQIAIYLCRDLTSASLREIGRIFERHPMTVVHSIDRIKQLRRHNQKVDQELNKIAHELASELESGGETA